MKDEEILDLIPNPIGLEVVVADVASQRFTATTANLYDRCLYYKNPSF